MLLERAERWPKQWEAKGLKKGRKQGLKKGLEKGLEKGLRRGKVELLKTLANQRFGELPQWAVERFDRADVDTLDRWGRRLLGARSLKEAFDDE